MELGRLVFEKSYVELGEKLGRIVVYSVFRIVLKGV